MLFFANNIFVILLFSLSLSKWLIQIKHKLIFNNNNNNNDDDDDDDDDDDKYCNFMMEMLDIFHIFLKNCNIKG